MPEEFGVFISYAKQDKEWIDYFVPLLGESLRKQQGILSLRLYRMPDPPDTVSQLAGNQGKELGNELHKASFFIAITSLAYVESQLCQKQWELFIKRKLSPTQLIEIQIERLEGDEEGKIELLQESRGGNYYPLYGACGRNYAPAADHPNGCRYEIEKIADDLIKWSRDLENEIKTIAAMKEQATIDNFVFIDAAPRDKPLAEKIGEFLTEKNISFTLPITLISNEPPLSAREIETNLIENVKRCKGLIIVSGTGVSHKWVEQHYRYYQQIKSHRSDPLKALALCEEKRNSLLIQDDAFLKLPCDLSKFNEFIEVYQS